MNRQRQIQDTFTWPWSQCEFVVFRFDDRLRYFYAVAATLLDYKVIDCRLAFSYFLFSIFISTISDE